MYYLIYTSTASRPMNYDDLSALLQQSREANSKLGLSGMLLYNNGSFMQMLEGDREHVLDLYEAIRKDSRHHGVHLVMSGEIEDRNFADWTMGFFNMDLAGEHPHYDDFIDTHLTLDNFNEESMNAYAFMVKFNQLIQ